MHLNSANLKSFIQPLILVLEITFAFWGSVGMADSESVNNVIGIRASLVLLSMTVFIAVVTWKYQRVWARILTGLVLFMIATQWRVIISSYVALTNGQ